VLVKDFNSVDDQVGFGDADDCFGITLEGINEAGFPFLWQCRIQTKSIFTSDIDEHITSSFMAGDYISGGIKIF